jgi:hypothetical protein
MPPRASHSIPQAHPRLDAQRVAEAFRRIRDRDRGIGARMAAPPGGAATHPLRLPGDPGRSRH